MTLGQQNLQQYLDDLSGAEPAAATHGVLAAYLGCSRSLVTHILNNHRIPGGKLAARIHSVAGVDPIDWYQEAKDE